MCGKMSLNTCKGEASKKNVPARKINFPQPFFFHFSLFQWLKSFSTIRVFPLHCAEFLLHKKRGKNYSCLLTNTLEKVSLAQIRSKNCGSTSLLLPRRVIKLSAPFKLAPSACFPLRSSQSEHESIIIS